MPISLTCPQCSSKLNVADNLVGKKIKCPKCFAVFPTSSAGQPTAITTKAPSSAASRGIKSKTESVGKQEEIEELEEVEEIEEVDGDLEERPRVRRRKIRRDPAEEAISTLIPYKNGRALAAYYVGVFSLIPCLGLLLGPAALVLGILGLRYVRANPTAKGTGHAIAGIVLGGLTTLGNWGVVVLLLVAYLKEGVRAFA